MNKALRIIIIVIVCLGILAGIIGISFKYGIQPVIHLQDITTFYLEGNSKKYSIKEAEPMESKLKDKTIIFLGSSVTYGAMSEGTAFPDYIESICACKSVKQAVSGTTLVDNGSTSYISRMKKIEEKSADLFVCQLSTNDATKKLPLGEVTDNLNFSDFDTQTVAGAIEYIIAYAKEKWDCPIVFYTNPEYDNDEYGDMVALLSKIQEKWGITVIDLWNDDAFNSINDEKRKLYMADHIHPTKAGYLKWWVPVFIPVLEQAVGD